MVAAMLFPWWSFKLQFGAQTDLYPYLISGPGSELVGYKRSPQMTILTGVLIVSIGLCFVGGVLRGKTAMATLGAAGILVLLAAWRLLVRVGSVAGRFEIPIQGHGIATYEGFSPVEVSTWLRPGLYLIVLAGVLCLAASLFHNRLRTRLE
jgi:hypothetical protein